jgi:hypothetical protein
MHAGVLDKMKNDTDLDVATKALIHSTMNVIEKTVLAQTEDQFSFATLYEQETTLFTFHQNLSPTHSGNERFNTKFLSVRQLG